MECRGRVATDDGQRTTDNSNFELEWSGVVWLKSLSLRALVVGMVGYPSGQRGQTVNLLAYAFAGSNPAPTTILEIDAKQRFKLVFTGTWRRIAGLVWCAFVLLPSLVFLSKATEESHTKRIQCFPVS